MEEKSIPKISISENEIVLETMTVPLIVNEKEEQIKFQKINAGQKRELIQSSASTKIIGQQVQGNIDAVGYQIGMLSKSIIEAPFPTDEKSISKLPAEVLDYLFGEYNSWAEPKKKD
jgi:hypothetical protein